MVSDVSEQTQGMSVCLHVCGLQSDVCMCYMMNISSRIVRYPWQMSEDKVRRVLQEALRVWSEVTPLTFTEVPSGKTDIVIDFTRYGGTAY